MTLKERCQAGEAKLEQISNALLDPRPEILDHCEAELQEVVIVMLSESADVREPLFPPPLLPIEMICFGSGTGSGCSACRCKVP